MTIEERCAEAKELYQTTLDPTVLQPAWLEAVDHSVSELRSLIGASENLTNIAAALRQSGSHMRALRHLLAPPLSQDQFKLACPEWTKSTEKSGIAIKAEAAELIAGRVREWLEPAHLSAIADGKSFDLLGAAYLMARQEYETKKRIKLARRQEEEICAVLDELGFSKGESRFVNEPGSLEKNEYLLATKFATADNSAHEVDVAVGLPGKMILAIECKVSNDATNSIKRTNDVIKKSEAWRRQWGNFVITGALIQGVFKPTEIVRMEGSDIVVFWSHALDEFRSWIKDRA